MKHWSYLLVWCFRTQSGGGGHYVSVSFGTDKTLEGLNSDSKGSDETFNGNKGGYETGCRTVSSNSRLFRVGPNAPLSKLCSDGVEMRRGVSDESLRSVWRSFTASSGGSVRNRRRIVLSLSASAPRKRRRTAPKYEQDTRSVWQLAQVGCRPSHLIKAQSAQTSLKFFQRKNGCFANFDLSLPTSVAGS